MQRKLRYDHDVRVALHLKTGDIARPQAERDLLPHAPSWSHEEPVARAENPVESAILPQSDGVQRHPDGIDAVRIFRADVARDRIRAARGHRRIVDRERDLRRPRSLPLAEAGRGEQEA